MREIKAAERMLVMVRFMVSFLPFGVESVAWVAASGVRGFLFGIATVD